MATNEEDHSKLFDAIEETPPVSLPADLTTVRKAAVKLRDAYLEKEEIEQKLAGIQAKINDIQNHELIDLFNEVGIASITVDPEGNHPGFIAERQLDYYAKIPEDKVEEAHEWFKNKGYGDLVKSVITVIFGMYEHDQRERCMELLQANKFSFSAAEKIHHTTLKAFVKREIQSGHVIPMDLLGASSWSFVRIKKD